MKNWRIYYGIYIRRLEDTSGEVSEVRGSGGRGDAPAESGSAADQERDF